MLNHCPHLFPLQDGRDSKTLEPLIYFPFPLQIHDVRNKYFILLAEYENIDSS